MAVVALPASDRRPPASEPVGKLALTEAGAPSRHEDVIAAAHTNTAMQILTARELWPVSLEPKCAVLCAAGLRTWPASAPAVVEDAGLSVPDYPPPALLMRRGRRSGSDRERQAAPIARGRHARLQDAERRLEQELAVDTVVNQAYEQFHVSGRDTLGRRIGKKPKPHTPPLLPEGVVNITDLDSRLIHDKRLTELQGYNAQAAVSCDGQIIVAAELSARSPDFGQLAPVFDAALRDLALAGVDHRPETVLADTGRYAFMRAVLDSPAGSQLYHRRAQSIEPTFGQIKHNRGFRQFRRRGRAAARSEWRPITATHNLLKLHKHWVAPAMTATA